MDRRGGYAKRRGILARPAQAEGTSSISIQRRENTENVDERESEGGSIEQSRENQTRPPVILMKPRSRKNEEDEDEEWPTIGGPTGTNSRRSESASRHVESGSEGNTAASSLAEETGSDQFPRTRSTRHHTPTKTQLASAASPIPTAVSYQIQQKVPGSHVTPSEPAPRETMVSGTKTLRGGIRLITEGMEWSETPLEYLQDQSNFPVIGILGAQGVGKSTLLSMIGGNDPFDMYRQYIFRPASKECTESNSRQTSGVHFYINDHRTILLDSQAILSSAVMEQLIQSDRRFNYESRFTENCMEIESLQIAAFMMQVCHVVVFLVDWFVDVDHLRFLQTAEMLKPNIPLSENPQGIEHYPHFVFVQNRGKREDFTLTSVKSKAKCLNKLFAKSNLLVKDGISLKNSSEVIYDSLDEEYGLTNLFILPDMKPRGYKSESLAQYKGIPDYEILVRDMRNQILALPRSSFGVNVQTEKQWFHHAARSWDMTRKSLLISEYGRMLP